MPTPTTTLPVIVEVTPYSHLVLCSVLVRYGDVVCNTLRLQLTPCLAYLLATSDKVDIRNNFNATLVDLCGNVQSLEEGRLGRVHGCCVV